MHIADVAQASVLSITMVHQQFTRTVRLDLNTCWRAWGYWMLERKAGATTDDESDSTDDESDAGNGYPLGWGLPTIEEDVPFAGNVSPVASPPHKIMPMQCERYRRSAARCD